MAKRTVARYAQTHSQGGISVEAYRGYLIQPASYGQLFYIQKGGVTIGSAMDSPAARAIIDMLLEGA